MFRASPFCRVALAVALTASVTVAAFPADVGATSVVEQRVPAMAASSERVVVARVLDVRVDRVVDPKAKGAQVVTKTTLEVLRALKGPAEPSRVELRELGGTAGEGSARLTQTIHGMPKWRAGEEVVVFLERTDTGRLVVAGLSRGKYTLERRIDGTVVVERARDDLYVVGRHRKPDRYFAGAPESDDRMTLSQLEDLIAGRRPGVEHPRVLRAGKEAGR
jgi:hypothetical protein